MNTMAEPLEGQLVEYRWGGHRWTAAAIARRTALEVWIASAEVERDQARYAFDMDCSSHCNFDEETIIAQAGAIDAMLALAEEYLLDIEEDDFCEEGADDEVFRFEFGPLSIKASVAKAS